MLKSWTTKVRAVNTYREYLCQTTLLENLYFIVAKGSFRYHEHYSIEHLILYKA